VKTLGDKEQDMAETSADIAGKLVTDMAKRGVKVEFTTEPRIDKQPVPVPEAQEARPSQKKTKRQQTLAAMTAEGNALYPDAGVVASEQQPNKGERVQGPIMAKEKTETTEDRIRKYIDDFREQFMPVFERVRIAAEFTGTVGWRQLYGAIRSRHKKLVADLAQQFSDFASLLKSGAWGEDDEKAVKEAKQVLLEPVMRLQIVVPQVRFGAVQGNLLAKRGLITGCRVHGNMQVIDAKVPLVEMFGYSSEIRSVTAGRGTFTMEPLSYERVPEQIASEVIF
jgi:hypothetical protein